MNTVEQMFGMLIESGSVVGIGPIESVRYGDEPTEFYVLTVNSGNGIEVHPGSTSLGVLTIPVPSVN